MEKKQNGEKCTGTFTKRIGNTTYRVNVHFAEDTTDTVEDKLLHLMGTVALVAVIIMILYGVAGLFLGATLNNAIGGGILGVLISGIACIIYVLDNQDKK